jgi:hypothetical protein
MLDKASGILLRWGAKSLDDVKYTVLYILTGKPQFCQRRAAGWKSYFHIRIWVQKKTADVEFIYGGAENSITAEHGYLVIK